MDDSTNMPETTPCDISQNCAVTTASDDGHPSKEPLVSVLMAAYNSSRYLKEAISSILAQTYDNWELVVLDDASTDDTWSILQSFAAQDARIKPFQNTRNLGFSGARNRLFSLMNPATEFIAVLDSDDIALPTRLKTQVDFLMAHPELSAVGSSIVIIDENSNVTSFRRYPTSSDAVHAAALKANPMAHSTLMMRHSIQKQLGEYDSSLSCCEDYDYLLRMLGITSYANLEIPQVAYRISSNQWTKRRVKHSLLVSQKVQRRFLFRRGYFSFSALLNHLARYALLILPQRWILRLFIKLTYFECPEQYRQMVSIRANDSH